MLACDEAYSEIYFGPEPPVSALALADRTNVVVFNTLSKRSSMPGYRSGFAAGDPQIIAALKRYRPNVGVAPQEFVQRAAAAAWGDEEHVDAVRELYRAKRDVVLPALRGDRPAPRGRRRDLLPVAALPAGETRARPSPPGCSTAASSSRPGAFFGSGGEGYVRVALVPTLDDAGARRERLTGV